MVIIIIKKYFPLLTISINLFLSIEKIHYSLQAIDSNENIRI